MKSDLLLIFQLSPEGLGALAVQNKQITKERPDPTIT